MNALISLQESKREQNRFKFYVDNLNDIENPILISSSISFINSLVNCPSDIDVRINLREELERLNFGEIVLKLKEKYKGSEYNDIVDQIDMYNEEKELDKKDIDNYFSGIDINLNSPIEIFEHIHSLVKSNNIMVPFKEIAKTLLMLPLEESGLKVWLAVQNLLRQISLSKHHIALSEENKIPLEDLLKSNEEKATILKLQKEVEQLHSENKKYSHTIKTQEENINKKAVEFFKLKVNLDVRSNEFKQIEEKLKDVQQQLDKSKKENEDLNEKLKNRPQQIFNTPSNNNTDTSSGNSSTNTSTPLNDTNTNTSATTTSSDTTATATTPSNTTEVNNPPIIEDSSSGKYFFQNCFYLFNYYFDLK